jgi:hypothetical protein
MRLTYVNAGAPACVGDAGLFGRSQLKANIDADVLLTQKLPLYFEHGEIEDIWPYLVGDAAIPLGQHMMKVIGTTARS